MSIFEELNKTITESERDFSVLHFPLRDEDDLHFNFEEDGIGKETYKFSSVNDVLNNDEFQMFTSGTDFLYGTTDRDERQRRAMDSGDCDFDGDTHYEKLCDVVEFLDSLKLGIDISLEDYNNIITELNNTIDWWEKNPEHGDFC
jgi:hypothetical protein